MVPTADRLPMFSDDPSPITYDEKSNELVNIVHLSAVDYACNFVLHSYGVIRPGADYYARKMKIYVFVIADLSCMSLINSCMCLMNVERAKIAILFILFVYIITLKKKKKLRRR